MSDPVANVDIEDVLSSIRRLVSNGPEKDGRAARDAREADRLVLTPSQRVDDAGEAEAGEAGRESPATARAGSAGVTEAHPPETDERDAWDDGLGIEPESADGDMAGDEVALAAFSLDMADAGDAARGDTVPDTGESDAREAGHGTGEEVGTGAEDPALEGIAAMFARHEAATPSTWEPDGDEEDAFADQGSAPALDWRDIDESDDENLYGPEIAGAGHAGRGPEPEGEGRAHARDLDSEARVTEDNAFAIDEEAVLDEEALRDLVAEIVREELMGTLGERITRNVRKLVRREIHRALNSQDFD